MKRILVLTFFAFSHFIHAQTFSPKFDLCAMGGWNLAGGTPYIKIVNAPIFTGAVDYLMNERMHIELSVNYMSSSYIYKPSPYVKDETMVPYTQAYIQGGLMRIFEVSNPRLMPFTLATIGAKYASVSYNNTPSEWTFAAGLNLGIKYMMNEKVGIRVQARLQSPFSSIGVGVGVGTGGVNVGVGSYSSNMQFDFSGGVFVRL